MTTEPLHTMAETAKILGISTKTLREHVKLGRIRYVKAGNGSKRVTRRFTDKNIATFIEKQKIRETAPWPSSSTNSAPIIKSSSNSTVIPFESLQKPPTRKKQKP